MSKPLVYEIYKAKFGWRWRLISGNNKKMANSGESYSTKSNAKRALMRLLSAPFIVVIKEPKA